MTVHRGHPVTDARHAALRSPLPENERGLPVDAAWLRRRARLFAAVSERPFHLVVDLQSYASVTGLTFYPHYAAQVYTGPKEARLTVPLMAVNLSMVTTREEADRALAHETMHLVVPSYGHKAAAFAKAQHLLDEVGQSAGAAT
ncbi:hypothetical protein OG369_43095 [Streptomyces sp. NBC_01221]|uniref:hypothetical protein n=1 Tax=Streptomyces sp. NBC_01221 TaxID=2903782 RepID=UPI002258E3D8|nr:hypothetical protein [Streptomyces sp. NBC_01221]MCX4792025.1 hypothetical protein [Streptomyces sp. NBC_01221]MCX4792565.1 hypothetical protein [Streptomyces sp. NBC_01221]